MNNSSAAHAVGVLRSLQDAITKVESLINEADISMRLEKDYFVNTRDVEILVRLFEYLKLDLK